MGQKMLTDNKIIKALLDLGLTRSESEIYYHLVKEGKCTADKIHGLTGKRYDQIYRTISTLIDKGCCECEPTDPIICHPSSPEQSIITCKEHLSERFTDLLRNDSKCKEPQAYCDKFCESMYMFKIMHSSNVVGKKINELIQNAEENININCSTGIICKLVFPQYLCDAAKDRQVKINVSSAKIDKKKESLLRFVDMRSIEENHNDFLSVDGKETLFVEPVPYKGETLANCFGVWLSSQSFADFMDEYFGTYFNQAKKLS